MRLERRRGRGTFALRALAAGGAAAAGLMLVSGLCWGVWPRRRTGRQERGVLAAAAAPSRRRQRKSREKGSVEVADPPSGLVAASDAEAGGLLAKDFFELADPLSRFSAVSDAEADSLFAKYDPDGSGVIDKEEFKAVASKLKVDSIRRALFTGVAAVVSGFLVGSYSKEFQLIQALTRRFYVKPAAEQAMNELFPTAVSSSDCSARVERALQERGFTSDNTLFAHSVCPDELNSKAEELVALMQSSWGEAFALGGLAGVPFAGKSGFEAFLHHTPDGGKVLIMFAPHLGVDNEGTVGRVLRPGQFKSSTACGAAVGAYKQLTNSRIDVDGTAVQTVGYDNQIEYIVTTMRPLLQGIEKSKNEQAYVGYQNYNIARDLMITTLNSIPDIFDWGDELAVVGGVMINRDNGGDFFQPLMFQVKTKYGTTVDIFEVAFGARPDLAEILGSHQQARRVLQGIW